MKNKKIYHPTIIIGMHRSGTTMLTRMLESLGLYVGWKKTGTHEAVFFQRLNKWVLSQCGASAESPGAAICPLRDRGVRKLLVDLINYSMYSPRVISYLGVKRYLRYHSPVNLDVPWGWKDPRSTFTLPIWLDIFPYAKVIHICRHGVDVANSFRSRNQKNLARIKTNYGKYKTWYLLFLLVKSISKERGLIDLRAASLEGRFTLWEEYVREARTHLDNLRESAIEVKYEDFLDQPDELLRALSDFCELSSSNDDIKKATEQVRSERAYAYRHDSELVAFAAKVHGRLQAHGY